MCNAQAILQDKPMWIENEKQTVNLYIYIFYIMKLLIINCFILFECAVLIDQILLKCNTFTME